MELPPSVKKEVIQRGTGESTMPYPDKTLISFHFETKDTEDGIVYDDSHHNTKPMQLILGKNFKIEIWETLLQTMTKGETSRYEIPKELCMCYPMVSKVIREANHPGERHRGGNCCGHLAHGTGHPDLDKLMHKPRDLTFTFEILDVNLPGEYETEAWYLTDDEKVQSIPELKAAGNQLYLSRDYIAAAMKYREAAYRLETLMDKEKPGSNEFKELSLQKVPLLLNLALALMKSEVYYEPIRLCTSVLEIDPENAKAVFRRGQGHKSVGNYEEARKDFEKALSLDRTLRKTVKNELAEIVTFEKEDNKAVMVAMRKIFNK